MIKKTSYTWRPQEPSSDFAEKVMARLLADPPPHLCTAAANVAVKSLGLKSMVLTLAVFIVPILVIAGLLLRAQLIQHDAPVAPPDATPRIAPSIEHPSPAPVPAPSNGPDGSSGGASRNGHSGAQPALPNAAPSGGPKGVTPSIRTRGEGGSNPGDAASEPPPGPFNREDATDALDKAFEKAKASCGVPAGIGVVEGVIDAHFYPLGNAFIDFKIRSEGPPECESPDKPDEVSAKQSVQTLEECIERNIRAEVRIKFIGPDKKQITHSIKF